MGVRDHRAPGQKSPRDYITAHGAPDELPVLVS